LPELMRHPVTLKLSRSSGRSIDARGNDAKRLAHRGDSIEPAVSCAALLRRSPLSPKRFLAEEET